MCRLPAKINEIARIWIRSRPLAAACAVPAAVAFAAVAPLAAAASKEFAAIEEVGAFAPAAAQGQIPDLV
jgi:hypothetical protein